MKNNFAKEIVAAVILIVLLLALLLPADTMMTPQMGMIILALVIVAFAIFMSLVWRERVRDEREAQHRMKAARLAYLFGSIVVVIGIVVQTLQHQLDPWLIITLVVMSVTKVFARAQQDVDN